MATAMMIENIATAPANTPTQNSEMYMSSLPYLTYRSIARADATASMASDT